MACAEGKLSIGSDEYFVIQFPPSEGLELQFKLGKILGPSVFTLFDKFQEDEDGGQGIAIANAINELFKNCDPKELTELIKQVVSRAKRNGKAIVFDQDFQDDYLAMYRVFIWVLRVNFENFFKGLGLENLTGKLAQSLEEMN